MDIKTQTSFIPKKSLVTTELRQRGVASVFTIIAAMIFVFTLLGSAGVYFYQGTLLKQIETNKNDLEKSKGGFDEATIQDLIKLDARIKVAKILIEKHIVISPFFSFLENSILKVARFDSLNLSALTPQKVTVSMHGQSINFGAVAYQSDVFGKANFLKDFLFSDLNLDQGGNVVFNFNATLDQRGVSYKEYLLGGVTDNLQ